jgi:peptidoglycan/LPS O-acetylase OafA/YrhL
VAVTDLVQPEARPATSPSLGYQPALDGLRGLAVCAIFAFHAGFSWAPGAFLSVSTFFTLSGFLITFLLLVEHERHGRIDRKAFWVRRARRLLPASLVTIAGIVIGAALFADASQLERLRGDVIAGLAYVANWRFIAAGDSYGALFQSESPMQHFWSLAIEEQFYLLYPLVFIALLALARGSHRRLAAGLALLVGASLATSFVLLARDASIDRLYFGTDVRAAELLVGALLAVWWSRRRHIGHTVGRRTVQVAGAVAFVAMVVLWAVARQGDRGWYQGGLLVYAVLTCIVILAALAPNGPVRRTLSFRPLVGLGVISYGAYLIHWPVFTWLNESTGLSPWPLFALRVAITIALAVALFRLVETPLRFGSNSLVRRGAFAVPVLITALIAGAVLVGSTERGDAYDFDAAREQLAAPSAGVTGTLPDRDQRSYLTTAMFGDSTALMTGLGFAGWGQKNPDQLQSVGGFAELGCGTVESSRISSGEQIGYPDPCINWPDRWARALAETPADLAVVLIGPWEVADTTVPGDDVFRSLGDPVLDAEVRRQLTRGVDALLAGGSDVILLTSPSIEQKRSEGRPPPTPYAETDPARMRRFNEIVREVAASRERVAVVDYGAYIDGLSDAEDLRLRPDGVHLTWDTANEVADWLGPAVVQAARGLPPRR